MRLYVEGVDIADGNVPVKVIVQFRPEGLGQFEDVLEEYGVDGWRVIGGSGSFAYKEVDGAMFYLFPPENGAGPVQPVMPASERFLRERLAS